MLSDLLAQRGVGKKDTITWHQQCSGSLHLGIFLQIWLVRTLKERILVLGHNSTCLSRICFLSSAFEPLSTQSLAVFSRRTGFDPFLAEFCVSSLMLSCVFHVILCIKNYGGARSSLKFCLFLDPLPDKLANRGPTPFPNQQPLFLLLAIPKELSSY